jgi:hypothetical protein
MVPLQRMAAVLLLFEESQQDELLCVLWSKVSQTGKTKQEEGW